MNPSGLMTVLLSAWLVVLFILRINLINAIKETVTDILKLRIVLKRKPILLILFFCGFGVIAMRSWLHIQLLPPYIWDVLSYHLPKVGDWVQYERLVAQPTSISRAYWPASFELLQAWSVVFFHHDWMVEAAGLPYYLLAIIAAYSIGRRLGLSGHESMLAGWAWATTPALLMNAVSCKNDIAIVAIYLLSIGLLLTWKDGLVKARLFWPMLISLLCWGIGIKATMVFIMPGIAVLFWFCLNIGKEVFLKGRQSRLYCVCLFLLSFLPASYWYLRNYLLFSNPFFPVDFRLFDFLVFGDGGGGGQQGTFKISSLIASTKALFLQKMFDLGSPMLTADLGNQAGWGWLAVSLGAPCLVVAFIRLKRFRYIVLTFLISFFGLYCAVEPDPWNMRFGFWFPVLFCLAWVITAAMPKRKTFRVVFIVFGISCCLLNIASALGTGYFSVNDWKEAFDTPLKMRASEPAIRRKLMKGLQPDEKVGFFVGSNYLLYRLYSPDFPRKTKFLDLAKSDSIASAMQDAGIRMIYVQDVDDAWLVKIEGEISQGRLEKFGDWGFYRIAEHY
jgi:hypothetical protein